MVFCDTASNAENKFGSSWGHIYLVRQPTLCYYFKSTNNTVTRKDKQTNGIHITKETHL